MNAALAQDPESIAMLGVVVRTLLVATLLPTSRPVVRTGARPADSSPTPPYLDCRRGCIDPLARAVSHGELSGTAIGGEGQCRSSSSGRHRRNHVAMS
jgi:hypothetical protein